MKDGGTDINFGSGVAGLRGEESCDRLIGRKRSARRHDFRGDGTDFVIALKVKFILAIGETGLCDSLETARPSEPLRILHGNIVAAEDEPDKNGRPADCSRVRRQKASLPNRSLPSERTRMRRLGRVRHRGSYMGIASLAWRATYQQGRLPAWGKSEWAQGTSSSGRLESISYSTLLFFSAIARTRVRWTEPWARPSLGERTRSSYQAKSTR